MDPELMVVNVGVPQRKRKRRRKIRRKIRRKALDMERKNNG